MTSPSPLREVTAGRAGPPLAADRILARTIQDPGAHPTAERDLLDDLQLVTGIALADPDPATGVTAVIKELECGHHCRPTSADWTPNPVGTVRRRCLPCRTGQPQPPASTRPSDQARAPSRPPAERLRRTRAAQQMRDAEAQRVYAGWLASDLAHQRYRGALADIDWDRNQLGQVNATGRLGDLLARRYEAST